MNKVNYKINSLFFISFLFLFLISYLFIITNNKFENVKFDLQSHQHNVEKELYDLGYSSVCIKNITIQKHKFIDDYYDNKCGFIQRNVTSTINNINYTFSYYSYKCNNTLVHAYIEYYNETVCVKEYLIKDLHVKFIE